MQGYVVIQLLLERIPFTAIVYKHDLLEQLWGSAIDDAVHGAEQRLEVFVEENDDDTHVG